MTSKLTHPSAILPRPIFHVKPYGYVVERGDTMQGITEKLGRPASDYHELVAANMSKHALQPMPLGSPYGCMTIADLAENETLYIPAHWPEVEGARGAVGVGDPETVGLGIVVMDPVAQSIINLVTATATAGGGPGAPYSPETVAAAANAAVSWWQAQNGTGGTPNPAAYMPYVQSALAWASQVVPGVIGQGVAPAQVGSLPWGAVIAMLPAIPDFTKVDWSNGSIPGSNGAPWSSLPWGYIAQLGTDLEKLQLGKIKWPSSPTPEAVLEAFKKVIADAVGAGQAEYVCGENSEVKGDSCYCKEGYTWADPNNISNVDCVPISTPAPPPQPSTPSTGGGCPAGSIYDAGAPTPGCYKCADGETYDIATHKCIAPSKPTGITTTATTETKIGPGAIALGALGLLALGGVAVFAAKKWSEEEPTRASNPRRK